MTQHGQNIENQLQEAKKLAVEGNKTKALEMCQTLIKEEPHHPEINFAYGKLLLYSDEKSRALEHLSQADELSPNNSVYLATLAEALAVNNYPEAAINKFQESLKLSKDNFPALTGLGQLLFRQEKFIESLDILKQAQKLNPNDTLTLTYLIAALTQIDQYQEALEYTERSLQLYPKNPDFHYQYARIHLIMGNTEEARKGMLKVLEIDPKNGQAYAVLVEIEKVTEKDRDLLTKMEELLSDPLPADVRDHVQFALGKAHNDLREWDAAFEHYQAGNDLIVSNYDNEEANDLKEKILKLFTLEFISSRQQYGNQSEQPVFIIGMPRSGSTLTDQILSSHSKVISVGELPEISLLSRQMAKDKQSTIPEYIVDATKEDFQKFANNYLNTISKVSKPETVRIVNKMPFNFIYVGLIGILFPKARFIYTKRDPLDTCLSCYFQRFSSPQLTWATDLTELGQYYRLHLDLMNHWKKESPLPILEVQYETLTADFNNQARRIIEFCGLKWEDACAEFYKSKREVRTASVMQVRQPIYSSSVKRWKNYARHLGPLVASLGDVVDDIYPELEEAGVPLNRLRKWKNKFFPGK